MEFIFLALAYKAVNNSAHTSFCPQAHMLFLPNLSFSCSFCVSPTQDFLCWDFSPPQGSQHLCYICTYIYYIWLYFIHLCIIICTYKIQSLFQLFLKIDIFPQRWRLHYSLHFICDTWSYTWTRTSHVCFVTLEKGLHLCFSKLSHMLKVTYTW